MRKSRRTQRKRRRGGRLKRIGPSDIKAIRRTLGKTQTKFARLIGVSVGTLRNWEQGRRRPEGAARALLRVVLYDPALVARALGSG